MTREHALAGYSVARIGEAKKYLNDRARISKALDDDFAAASHVLGWLCGYTINESDTVEGAEVDGAALSEMLFEFLTDLTAARVQLDEFTVAAATPPAVTEFTRILAAAEKAAETNTDQARILLDIAIASKGASTK